MDTYPITARSLGRYFKVDGNNLERAYKEHLSGFRDWDQLKHAGDWILLPENVGEYMSIDESMHGKDLYTFLTNKEGHGGPNSLVAVVKGTTAKEVVARFLAIPEDKRLAVKEVTMDFSNSMFSIVRQAFPNATIVIDCFHIMKLAGEALEAMRLKLKRLAQKEQKKEERDHRKKLARRAKARRYYYRKHPKKRGERRGRPRKLRANERFVLSKLSNGETKVDLLTHVRYPLLKSMDKWTDKQKDRMKLLYEIEPRMKTAYLLVNKLRNIFKKRQTRDEARMELHSWYKEVGKSLIRELIAVRDTIKLKEEYVLNYFINRSTNASAESINSKMKGFRSELRGVADIPFFMFRLSRIFG